MRVHPIHYAGAAVVAALFAAILWFTHSPGFYSIDEGHYLLAAANWHDNRTFAIDNGYEQFPHELLLPLHPSVGEIAPTSGRLTTFIPPLYTFVGAGFYGLLGERGLVLMNMLGIIGLALVCGRLAVRLAARVNSEPGTGGDLNKLPMVVVFWGAIGLLLFSTYLAEYIVSISNHVGSLLLLFVAISLHPIWREGNPSGADTGASLNALMCGFTAGVSLGFRLQYIVAITILGAAFFLVRNRPVRLVVFFVLGLAGPVAAISWINHLRFGIGHPFTYGMAAQNDLIPLIGDLFNSPVIFFFVSGALLVFGVAVLTAVRKFWARAPEQNREKTETYILPGAAILFILIGIIVPPLSGVFAARVTGVALFTGDTAEWMRAGPLAFWVGTINSLIQSYPLAPFILLLPFVPRALRQEGKTPDGKRDIRQMIMLGMIAWATVLFVCFIENSGGHQPNQRYLLEVTVIGSVLLPAIILPLLGKLPRTGFFIGGAVALLHMVLVGWLLLDQTKDWTFLGKTAGEAPIAGWDVLLFVGADRVLPVLYSFAAICGCLIFLYNKNGLLNLTGRWTFSIFLIPCLTTPLFNHIIYDYRAEMRFKRDAQTAYEILDTAVPEETLLIVPSIVRTAAVRLKADKDIWVSHAGRTEWRGTAELSRQVISGGERRAVVVVAIGFPKEIAADLARDFEIVRIPAKLPILLFHPKPPETKPNEGNKIGAPNGE